MLRATLSAMRSRACVLILGVGLLPSVALAQNLVVNGGSMTLSGVHRYDNVCVINGGTINVAPYAGGSKASTGNLELIAGSIYVDATSKIAAHGAGYQAALCSDGPGTTPTAGGRGGCSVMDSGGGGAHFGRGGRGTVDNPTSTANSWQNGFPSAFEDDCNIDFNVGGATCVTNNTSRTLCTTDGVDDDPGAPFTDVAGATVAGLPYWHNIYDAEFGSAGGDKGCRDGDGRTGNPMAGGGGGRVVLVGLSERNPAAGSGAVVPSPCAAVQGSVRIEGTIDANGKRGCGAGNDSGGGGGGGSLLLVGQTVQVGTNAKVMAAGGLGGDTNAASSPESADCNAGVQAAGGTCDDCGGGGGGGIISVLSVSSDLKSGAQFNVNGALGGVCTVCNGEAGGGAGELQLDGAYVGEYCDGYDNDFDGQVDEMLGSQDCGLGNCVQSIPMCTSGAPVACSPTVTAGDATCKAGPDGARPRVAVILDTSASMLLNLSGYPTFGDGSVERPGIDTPSDPDSVPNDSRLNLARESLAQVISAYPEIDFALARYHQDQGINRSCQTAKWFECQGLVGTYDNPSNNSGPLACTVNIGPSTTLNINADPNPTGMAALKSECVNYAGSCGGPRRGADILSGFGSKARDIVRWLDGKETNFSADMTTGNICQHNDGVHDCEVRGSGPTPLAGSLISVEDYVSPIRQVDSAAMCRGYSIILVTDGAESCNGNPQAAAQHLHDVVGIDVYVVAVSVLASEQASLNQIARAGSGNARDAIFVSAPQQLVPALTSIIAGAIRSEACNGLDDDCDSRIDEDFPGLGSACDDKKKGVCRSEGTIVCNPTHDAAVCVLDHPGETADAEKCNSLDDDCDGAVDEGLDCDMIPCTHTGGEVCNGQDDDCDTKIDEDDPALGNACGVDVGECRAGTTRCVLGGLRCIGGVTPTMEQCNGKDDDCNNKIDDDAPCPGESACIDGACRAPCSGSEFSCPVGQECKRSELQHGDYCVPTACALCKSTERCINEVCVDPCKGVSCEPGLICVRGDCRDCNAAGCPSDQVCYERTCQARLCDSQSCGKSAFCFNGECVPQCDDARCGSGERCNAAGVCERDVCAGVSCEDGKVCREGKCESDPCRTMGCGVGETCVAEVGCIPDPCTVTVCGEGTLCSVGPHGEPRCTNPGLVVKRRAPVYVSTGGSGLSTNCSVGLVRESKAPASAWLLFGALGLAALRRRGVRVRRQKKIWMLWAAGLFLLGGCKTDALCLDCLDVAGNGGFDAGTGDGGGGIVPRDDGGGAQSGEGGSNLGGRGGAANCVPLGDEVCNKLDDDCDGKTDEDFDLMTNVRHCGGCDQACQADNAETSCQEGKCKVGTCLAGFEDLDKRPGCEYRCPIFPAAAEDCNGLDDDCDGAIDEELTAPSGDTLCRHTAGTPCEHVKVICTTREKKTTWFCDYPSVVDFDPVVPNGIRLEEQRCDGEDNDCDTRIDEPWPELGEPCDDGKIGPCRNGGAMVCTDNQKASVCDLNLPPDAVPGAGPDAIEICNDVDDNCDGIIDNPDPLDPKHVVDSMLPVSHAGHSYYVYTFEASRPDGSATNQGIATARACSRAGSMPWTYASFAAATAACAASGKRLCTADEWLWACQSETPTVYPYGANYAANTCNGADHDIMAGDPIDNGPVVSGSMAMCISAPGVYDMSGNVKEWVNDQRGTSGAPKNEPIYVVRGGSYESPRLGLTCQTELSQAAASTVLPGLGFRCCSDAAP
jgi:hypothetical protein